MKHNRRVIIVTGILLVILVFGIYFLLQNENPAEDGFWICDEGWKAISEVQIRDNRDEMTLAFEQAGENWIGSDGSRYTVDQFAPYVATLGYMKAEEKIQSVGTAEEYGVKDPIYTIRVKYDNKRTYTYSVGTTLKSKGMYIALGESEDVYLIDMRRGDVINQMIASLYNVPLTDVRFNEVRGIQIHTVNGEQIMMNRSESPRANGDFYWNIFKPFLWKAESDKVKEFIADIEQIGELKRVRENITEEQCGLAGDKDNLARISIYDTYDSELTLYLGKTEGEYVYCKTNHLDEIYRINGSIMRWVEQKSADLLDRTLYYYEIPSTTSCTVTMGSDVFELQAIWTINENGKSGQRYLFNDKAISGAEYSELVSWFEKSEVIEVDTKRESKNEEIGRIQITRLSPPYEQTMIFREVADNNEVIQVDFEGDSQAYIRKEDLHKFKEMLQVR